MNSLDNQYQDLLADILDNGITKSDRTGTGTISVFGRQIRHNMSEGFPLLTTKKVAFKSVITELLWFLRGDTSIKYLLDNNCNIWNGDVYKRYIDEFRRLCPKCPELTQDEFVQKLKTDDDFCHIWGDLGPIYGSQWRNWASEVPFGDAISSLDRGVDQISKLMADIKANPDSRRLMVSAWNVADLDQMVLPPCHYGFQVYTRKLTHAERLAIKNTKHPIDVHNVDTEESMDLYRIPSRAISLMWNQRSVDTFLGLPFNIASYGLLLIMLADELEMVPEELIGNLGDTHLYLNHIDQARKQMLRTSYPLPTVVVKDGMFCSSHTDVILENYKSHPAIKADLSN